MPETLDPGALRHWSNALFVNMALGETFDYKHHVVTLLALEGDACEIEIDGQRAWLRVARKRLPTVLNGVRVFLADNRVVADLTEGERYPLLHGGLTGDALLCFSDPKKPLLDRKLFRFPIDREQGFEWTMEEDSCQFAYLHHNRAHEGVDIYLHDARGQNLHALLAIEDGTIAWVDETSTEPNQACVLLESASEKGLFYAYQHLDRRQLLVKPGQFVRRGQPLGFIWGDSAWGHLHFAVIGYGPLPSSHDDIYTHEVNCFPMLYELYHGDLVPRPRLWRSGEFSFDRNRAANGNKKRLSEYSELLGYGWLMGRWNPAGEVEPLDVSDWGANARLRNPLFPGRLAECRNPNDYYEFAVAVPDGPYQVQAVVGDRELATWQEASCNGEAMGTYALEGNRFAWTSSARVMADDGMLRMRLTLRDGTPAGLSEFIFYYDGQEAVGGDITT